MKAIIDCNSFYCSCEKLFKPELEGKPVIVLSNNDGCIISRTDEAKKIGVEMGGPYFMAKPLIEKHGVATFSSNYNLYGDLSWRVMETLRGMLPPGTVEVYSVDEAFLDLAHIAPKELQAFTFKIKDTVEQWTGIKVSIGVAPTKVLSKVANRLCKKNKQVTNCVLLLDSPRKIEQALERTPVEDIWGVGHQYAKKLQLYQINNALELSKKDIAWATKNLGGVVGAKLVRELKGIPSREMEDERTTKKMIATTRMFGSAVTELEHIKEAVATYTSRAAEKLRRQHSAASCISVMMIAKEEQLPDSKHYHHGASISSYVNLPIATSLTNELIKAALQLTERLFEKGRIYKKAGVILSGIVPDSAIQASLFKAPPSEKNRMLMSMMDNINFAMRNDVLKFAAAGVERDWKMRQELRSPRYTTRWEELCAIK
ncbi:MAG: Y-family DNA polymerase [Bacteroidota bacterium]